MNMYGMAAVCFLSMAAFAKDTTQSTLLPAGAIAPSFSLPLLDGNRLTLSTYCGETLSRPYLNKIRNTVVLSFWATYCKPCQKEIPELMSFAQKHKDDRVLVWCINIDKEGAALVGPFVNDRGYTVQVLLDPYMKTSQRYGVRSLPSLFVIDTLGVIRYSSSGYDEKNPIGLKLEAIRKAMREGRPVPVSGETAAAVPIHGDTLNAIAPKTSGTAKKAPAGSTVK